MTDIKGPRFFFNQGVTPISFFLFETTDCQHEYKDVLQIPSLVSNPPQKAKEPKAVQPQRKCPYTHLTITQVPLPECRESLKQDLGNGHGGCSP